MRWEGSRAASISLWTFSAEKWKYFNIFALFPADFCMSMVQDWGKREIMLLWNALACGLTAVLIPVDEESAYPQSTRRYLI